MLKLKGVKVGSTQSVSLTPSLPPLLRKLKRSFPPVHTLRYSPFLPTLESLAHNPDLRVLPLPP